MIFPRAATEVGNIDSKLHVVALVTPTHDVIDLEIVLGAKYVRMRAAASECTINDDLLGIQYTTGRVVILLVKKLQLIQQRWGDDPSIIEDHIIFTRLRI